jgi:tetratricopeptide (TPR) repeat protein
MTGTSSQIRGGGSLEAVLSLLRADAPGKIMGAPEDWPRWALLLPHVLAATSHFDTLSGQAQRAAGADASWLLDRAATYLQVHARLADARALAERALAIAEAAYGPDDPAVAAGLSNLALILGDLGRAAEARPLAERALAIDEAAYGPDHPDVATDLNNLASILGDLGQLAEAWPLAERALAITEAAYGPDHPTVATLRTNLAAILADPAQPDDTGRPAGRPLSIDEAPGAGRRSDRLLGDPDDGA